MEKLKTLSKLIQVKSHTLKTRQQFVGKLRQRLTGIEDEIRGLRATLDQEKEIALQDPQAMVAYHRYATLIADRITGLERFRKEAEAQISKEQDKLATLYADLRVHENIYEDQKSKKQKKIKDKEQVFLDDLFSSRTQKRVD